MYGSLWFVDEKKKNESGHVRVCVWGGGGGEEGGHGKFFTQLLNRIDQTHAFY